MLIDKGDISNYLWVDTKISSDYTFELMQSHIVKKIINHIRLTVYASHKSRKASDEKILMDKEKYSLVRKGIWNYRAAVGMLSYLQGYTRPEISMTVHQCERFCNSLCLMHKCAIRRIAKYLVRTSIYVDLPYGNW